MLVREISLGSSLMFGMCRISLGAISGDTRTVHLCCDLLDPGRPWLRHRKVKLIEVAIGESFDLLNGVTVQVLSAKRKTIKLKFDNPDQLPLRLPAYKGAPQ